MNQLKIENLLLKAKEFIEADPGISEAGTKDIIFVLSEIEQRIGEIVNIRNEKKDSKLSFGNNRSKQDKIESRILRIVAKKSGIVSYGKSITGILEEVEKRRKEIFELNDLETICNKYNIKLRTVEGILLNPSENIRPTTGSGNGLDNKEIGSSKIYHILDILRKIGVFGDDLIIRKGILGPKMIRSKSYCVISIPRINKSIFVCESYGEATFICQGFVSDEELIDKNLNKNELLKRHFAIKIKWNDDIKKWKNILSEKLISGFEQAPISSKIKLDDFEDWRKMLIESQKILEKEAGIEVIDGIWYFGECKNREYWPKISGKNIQSFPTSRYNKERGIGNQDGLLLSSLDLKKMFASLGVRVATEEEELGRYRDMIIESQDILEKEAGIEVKDGIWFLNDAKSIRNFPKIKGKNIRSFPSQIHNKNIGIMAGQLNNPKDLKIMFKSLGIRVATEEEELLRFRNILIESQEILEKEAGIEVIAGIWYFEKCKSFKNWPVIGGKKLNSFPNIEHNRKIGIKNPNGQITNPHDLMKMFSSLGIRVATEEEKTLYYGTEKDEIMSYKNLLIDSQEILEKEVGIVIKNGIWYFSETNAFKFWPKIGGKKLNSFPSLEYNRLIGIKNPKGQITNSQDLKKMISSLGIRVATEEEELLRYRDLLIESQAILEKTGIEVKEGVWYFGKCKCSKFWPKIGGKKLNSFPSRALNKEKGIGTSLGQITNPHDLKKMFAFLGIKVATEEQEGYFRVFTNK